MKFLDQLFSKKKILKSSNEPSPSAYSGGRRSAGYSGATRSSGAKFDYGLSTSSPSRLLDHTGLRQQARDAYHDTPQAKALVDRFADSVVDIGLRLELNPKAEILGIDPKKLEAWSAYVEEAFDSWAHSKTCHRAQNMNFYQAQRLYAIQQQRDNDQFIRLFYSSSKDLLNPLQFEMFDPNQIRGHGWTSTWAQIFNDDGIIRNADGTEKSYLVWYRNQDIEGKFEYAEIPRLGSRSKLPHMIHGFYTEYAGQKRGFSRLAHAIQEFENITDFSLSVIKKAINISSFLMAVENDQQDPSDPLEDIARIPGGAGPAASMFGSKSFEDKEPTQEELDLYSTIPNYTPIPEATLSNPGSLGFFNLAKGDKLKLIGDKAASDSYDSFVTAFTSHLSASMGMPVEVLLMKFSSNYSASRAALILFWRIAQIWQHEMASDFLDPVFETWLSLEIASGRIQAPGWSDPLLRRAWVNCTWIGAPMPNIDPQKTANADRAYVEMGATTLERVSRNLNGSSSKSNREKLRREYSELPTPPWSNWDDGDGPTIVERPANNDDD